MSAGCDCELSWLCCLIGDSLRSYTDPKLVVSVSKEREKEILVGLSKVLTQIQLRNRGIDSDALIETLVKVKPARDSECSSGSNLHSEFHQCLPRIVTDMIVLLTVKSQFVQHLAGKVLVSISEFVSSTGNNWDEFIHLLCFCMESTLARTLSYSSASSSGHDHFNSDWSSIDYIIRLSLINCDWSTVAGINKVLCSIFKYLTEICDDKLIKVCCDSVSSCLSNVPWGLLDEYQANEIGGIEKSSCADALHLKSFSLMQEPAIKFLGTFVQLLCSLVDQNDCVEAGGKQGDNVDTSIIQYFRHKLLILMTRLSFHTCLDCSVLLSWLQLLHCYFQELLWQPINEFHCGQDSCLKDSPFLLSLSEREVLSVHSSHLQRQAIFLFLKCSFSLICPRGNTGRGCMSSTSNLCMTSDTNLQLDCCCKKKGFVELNRWLQGHLPKDMFLDCEDYCEICMKFSSSFLKLYLHEDDLLFEVLLQLLSMASVAEQQFQKEKAPLEDVMKNITFNVSDLFNPVHLFHLLLSEIHYDHHVLLDYLISKDTGISCAKYLLRCLRLVCDSWDIFMEFSVCGELSYQSTGKRRRISGISNFGAVTIYSQVDSNSVFPSVDKECKGELKYNFKCYRSQPFNEAKKCLLSLKKSVENLHQKNLFPYNPEVLLKRLRKFQELCFNGREILQRTE
ncbi:Protein Lines [Quillaja saponaria]|uniref:Protein Lines n=1 Tax=Quillaja saponaria TaxID=32244 RepID=A0AAD7P6X4_QUISA|nr:Protein Lines [Quillaja saponaria]